MVRWRGGESGEFKKKKEKGNERAAPYSRSNFWILCVNILQECCQKSTNACSKYNVQYVHLFSFTKFVKRFLGVENG